MKGNFKMSEINFDVFEKDDVNSGNAAAVIDLKDGIDSLSAEEKKLILIITYRLV